MYILGDIMVKKLNGYLLTKKKKHKNLVKFQPFLGAKVSCTVRLVKPTIRGNKPDKVVLHAGTNDLRNEKTSSQISKCTIELVISFSGYAWR